MKKTLKIFFIFIFTLLVFSTSKRVEANYIEKISMDIYIDNNGNASITEIWNCYTDSGTEVYHPYYNLGNSKISNLTVSEDDTDYQSLTTWDTSKSLEEKAYKCGINTISNGVELCWGISSYSAHTYIVKYNISNFIANLNDSQMLYWTFIPYDFSNTIGDAYIKIYTDFSIPDNIDVWGYGNYGGTAYVYDGYIEMESKGRLDKNEYMTMLVKFPNNTFNVTSNNYNNNFEDYYNMAEQGATQYSRKTSGVEIIVSLIGFILSIAPFIVFIIIAIATQKNLKIDELKFGTEGKKIPKDVPYFRDIPCNNNIFKANYISYSYGISKNKTDILGAIILKWLKDNIVKVKKVDANGVFKKENISIILNENNLDENIKNQQEKELFKMLLEASKDGILEKKEFEKWCDKNYSKILEWFDNILVKARDELIVEGLIIEKEKTYFKFFVREYYEATPELKEKALQIAGLKRYLKEYTLIKDREPIEVKLFEEYLIYAQMMGIAKKVSKDFKDIYPEIIEQSHFDSYDNIIFINSYAAYGISSAKSAETRANNYSSGGGGFSSGGGGGGSFGGGGGRRRFPLE